MKNINLLTLRFLFYTFAIFQINPSYFMRFSEFPEVLWLPAGVFESMEHPLRLSLVVIKIFCGVWYLLAALCALNIRFKECSLIFAVMTFFMLSMSYNFGARSHVHMSFVMISFLLSLAGGNAVQMAKILFCMIFFSAGLSKLRNGGIDWMASDSLQNMLLRSEIFYGEAHPWASAWQLNIKLAQHPTLCRVIAFSVVILELSAPLALIGRRWATVIVSSLFLMQLGIYFTIFVNFKVYLATYMFWINWEAVLIKTNLLPVMRKIRGLHKAFEIF